MPLVFKNVVRPPARRSLETVHETWKQENQQRALGALTLHGGLMQGTRLAGILGVSPRGLRQVLRPLLSAKLVVVEIRAGDDGVGENWFRLDPSAIPRPTEPPPLLHHQNQGSVALTAPRSP